MEGESFHNKTITNEDDALLDIKVNGLWRGRFSQTIVDAKTFNIHAKSCPETISDANKYCECRDIKIPTKISGCGTQQFCSTNFWVYWSRSENIRDRYSAKRGTNHTLTQQSL